MSAVIKQAVNQVRLTNVAYVRLHRNGKRFEIACYRNKALNWRNKIETSLEEVLQADTVFTNVSKGLLASSKDLQEAFGTSDHLAVCREILEKGDLQVSEQERTALLESTFRDVASIVAEKTVNPENNRPYTMSMIQNAMKDIHFSVNMTKSAKSQALDVIRRLKAVMPIARSNMSVRLTVSDRVLEPLKELFSVKSGIQLPNPISVPSQGGGPEVIIDITIDPELFKKIEELTDKFIREKTTEFGAFTCRLEVLQLRAADASNVTVTPLMASLETPAALSESAKTVPPEAEKSALPEAEVDQLVTPKSGKKKKKDSRLKLEKQIENIRSAVKSAEATTDETDQLADEQDLSEEASSDDLPASVFMELGKQKCSSSQQLGQAESKKAANKKGKLTKRLEKEEKLVRTEKMQAIKDRIAAQSAGNDVDALTHETQSENAPERGKSCTTCGGLFGSLEYRNHFRSEWHRCNLSRKMKGLSTIRSEKEFNELSLEELEM